MEVGHISREELNIGLQTNIDKIGSGTLGTTAKDLSGGINELVEDIGTLTEQISAPSYTEILTQNAKMFNLGTGKNSSGVDIDVNSSVVEGIVDYSITGDTINIHEGKTISDFNGKIAGSDDENPNRWRVNVSSSNITVPSGFTLETDTNGYGGLKSIDANCIPTIVSVSGNIAQQLFSFNLIKIYENKYGVIPSITQSVADKVAWLKTNLTYGSCAWNGYGSCPKGYKANLATYSKWSWRTSYLSTNSTPLPSQLTQGFNQIGGINIPDVVDGTSDGFIHFLVYTDMASTTSPTVLVLTAHELIDSDYVVNVTRNIITNVSIVGGTDRVITSPVAGQTSGDIINKFHRQTNKTAETGTTTTNIKITAHGLSTGDLVYNSSVIKSVYKITVIDVDNFTVPVSPGQTTGNIIQLYKFFGQQTAEATVIPSAIYSDYINLEIGFKPRYLSVGETYGETKVRNMFDKTKAMLGYYLLSTTGTSLNGPLNFVTDYTEVRELTTYSWMSVGFAVSYFNASKVIISGQFIPTGTSVFTTPINCKYVKTDGAIVDINKTQLTKGIGGFSYHPYKSYIPYGIDVKSIGIGNLFDIDDIALGDLRSDGRYIVSTTGTTSGFIPVKPNTVYSIKRNTSTWFIAFAYASLAESSCIFPVLDNLHLANFQITTPNNAKYIRINFNYSIDLALLDNIQMEEGTISPPYRSYVVNKRTLVLTDTLKRINSTLFDKYEEGQVTRKISNWLLITGDYSWTMMKSNIGGKSFEAILSNEDIVITPDPLNQIIIDPRGVRYNINDISQVTTYSNWYNNSNPSFSHLSGDRRIRFAISNIDTGMCDGLSPTSAEAKAYFNGYKMCHSDGVSPYQKSETPYTPSTWSEWTKTSGVVGDITGLQFTGNSSAYQLANLPTNIKATTKYGLLYNVISSTLSNDFYLDSGMGVYQTVIPKSIGNNATIVTSLGNITVNKFGLMILNVEPNGTTIKVKDVRLFELPIGSQIETDFNTLTADQLASKYLFYGLNPKNWKSVVDGSGLAPVLPTTQAPNYTPYKMIYQLAKPIAEVLNVEGDLPLSSFTNGSMYVDGGLVLPTVKYTVPINFKATMLDNNAAINDLKAFSLNLDMTTTMALLSIADKELANANSMVYNVFTIDTGTVNAVVLTPGTPITSYQKGMRFRFIPKFENTGNTVINVSGIGNIMIAARDTHSANNQWNSRYPIQPGDLNTDEIATVEYDGSYFVLLNKYNSTIFNCIPNNGNCAFINPKMTNATPNYSLIDNMPNFMKTRFAKITCFVKPTDGPFILQDTCFINPTAFNMGYYKIVFTKNTDGIFVVTTASALVGTIYGGSPITISGGVITNCPINYLIMSILYIPTPYEMYIP